MSDIKLFSEVQKKDKLKIMRLWWQYYDRISRIDCWLPVRLSWRQRNWVRLNGPPGSSESFASFTMWKLEHWHWRKLELITFTLITSLWQRQGRASNISMVRLWVVAGSEMTANKSLVWGGLCISCQAAKLGCWFIVTPCVSVYQIC
jgi:hypothetical protein